MKIVTNTSLPLLSLNDLALAAQSRSACHLAMVRARQPVTPLGSGFGLQRVPGTSTESEDGGDDRDDEERHGPVKHDAFLMVKRGTAKQHHDSSAECTACINGVVDAAVADVISRRQNL
jgi:hypothetical protein